MDESLPDVLTDMNREMAYRAISRLEVMPSMRAMWAAGDAARNNHVTLYNCSYLVVNCLEAFSETMFILMCGTGVGFSIERHFIDQLPDIHPRTGNTVNIAVEDSREGWASALYQVLVSAYRGDDFTVDYSHVRPRGARLITMGGRASGPEPLRDLFEFIRKSFQEKYEKKQKRLNSIDCLDIMNKIAEIVVAGGVRRSSQISLSDLDDKQVSEAKMGEFWNENAHRSMSNNSAVYNGLPEVTNYLDQFTALIRSKAGERGIFNREAARKQMTISGRRKDWEYVGTNPCVTGDTVIATLNGPKTFKELADDGSDVLVYSWHPSTKTPVVRTMRRPHKTRIDAEILEVTFDSGLKVRCTTDHSFYSFRGNKVKACDLTVGQSIRAFSMSKDSTGHLRVHGWDSERNLANHQWVARMVYENTYGPIKSGLIIHHKDENVDNNEISNLETITELEHNQTHYLNRLKNGFHHPASTVETYLETIECKNHKVVSVKVAGYEDVYNGCVDDSHSYIILDPDPVAGIASGIVSANCGEIILRDQEFCNLSEVVVRYNDTLETLRRKVKVAVMFGAWQSTFTNFPMLRPNWAANCNEERLLGASLTGMMDNPILNNVNDKMKRWMSDLRGLAIAECERWAKKLDINMSAAITCVKPSGTVSQLVDCASGIHQRYADFYIRRYRISATDPLFRLMADQGVPFNPEVGQDAATAATMVLDFPFASPKGAKTRHSFTAMQQLEHWRAVKDFWCEHNPSITVYVGEDEWVKTASWVYDNFDDVCGISFLPKSNHIYQLAPYEEISKEQYKQLAEKFPKIDYSLLSRYEMEDNTEGAKAVACTGDKCEL